MTPAARTKIAGIIYFSSDWHIGHDKEFIWKERGFATLADHDAEILRHVDALKKPDTLYFLGDMAMTKERKELIADVFRRCKATIVFCRGNHDPTELQIAQLMTAHGNESSWMTERLGVKSALGTLRLGHYPPRDAEGASYNAHAFDAPEHQEGSRIVHGHTHSKIKVSPRGAINVCWDAWGRFPTLEDLEAL